MSNNLSAGSEDAKTESDSLARRPDTRLEDALAGFEGDLPASGDCLVPRTAEEAVYEGMTAGLVV